ncbi:MAG: 30S ribosomal protein S11 [Bdellovibrionales bacterium]|nr:30S ribosomal protein S11 [Bdellovibrionales bacterium]
MAEAEKKKKKVKKKVKKQVPFGRCYINSGFGNTMVSFSDLSGNVLCWSSSGLLGFKGSRKGTPFVAQSVAEDAAKKALDFGLNSVEVHIKGPGAGREMAVRAIAHAGLKVNLLRDVTPLPHNGCRPPKKRRV